MANTEIKTCPKCCAKHLVFINGCGWDYDAWVCMNKACDYTEELEVSTMPDGADNDDQARVIES